MVAEWEAELQPGRVPGPEPGPAHTRTSQELGGYQRTQRNVNRTQNPSCYELTVLTTGRLETRLIFVLILLLAESIVPVLATRLFPPEPGKQKNMLMNQL